jgi:hypothetical protein
VEKTEEKHLNRASVNTDEKKKPEEHRRIKECDSPIPARFDDIMLYLV